MQARRVMLARRGTRTPGRETINRWRLRLPTGVRKEKSDFENAIS